MLPCDYACSYSCLRQSFLNKKYNLIRRNKNKLGRGDRIYLSGLTVFRLKVKTKTLKRLFLNLRRLNVKLLFFFLGFGLVIVFKSK